MSGTINFPANPTVGQTYTFAGATWEWNGTTWVNANTGTSFVPTSGGVTVTAPINLTGVSNGSNAAAGQIGEVVTATSGPTGVSAQVTSNAATISLTAGDWDVNGACWFQPSGGNITVAVAGISLTSATMPANPLAAAIQISNQNAVGFVVPTQRVNVSATTTVYLAQNANFLGTCTVTGYLYARRMR